MCSRSGAGSVLSQRLADNKIDLEYARAKVKEYEAKSTLTNAEKGRLDSWRAEVRAKTNERAALNKQREQLNKSTITHHGREYEFKKTIPNGWKVDWSANAPKGYVQINNGKSRFIGNERKVAFVLADYARKRK